MKLTISGYSTALFSTFYFIEELGLLFDIGDGVCAHLLQKARKIKHVFVSHPDRDHLAGMIQFNQLNAREGWPIIHYPKDCGSFPALRNFSILFDPHVKGTRWEGMAAGDEVFVKAGYCIRSYKNNHIQAPEGRHKSFGFKLFEVRQKLKEELKHLDNQEIQKIRLEKGRDAITETHETLIFTYSGDTPAEHQEEWNDSKILIHEATFLDKSVIKSGKNKHSSLEEVLQLIADSNVEQLILGHFSSRYSKEQIDEEILRLCEKYKIEIPVHRVLPSQFHKNILAEMPIYNPVTSNI